MDKNIDRKKIILAFLPYTKQLSDTLCYFRGVSDRVLKEDCRSAAIESMIRAIDRYDLTKGAALKTWVTISVRNSVKEYLRVESKRGGKGKAKYSILPDPIESFDNVKEYSIDSLGKTMNNVDLARKALVYIGKQGRTPNKKAEVFWAYFVEGKRMREIAVEHNCTLVNISLMISKAKNDIINSSLKKEWEK